LTWALAGPYCGATLYGSGIELSVGETLNRVVDINNKSRSLQLTSNPTKIKMEDIAIKNAVGHEDNKSKNAMVVTKDLLNGISFPCLGEKCQFYTPVCTYEKVALKVLKNHFKNDHETGSGETETKGSDKNRMWVPEILALDPNNDNEDAYQFWLDRFYIYLKECHITKTKEKYDKLQTRLAFNIYQHVVEAGNYEDLIEALDRLYV